MAKYCPVVKEPVLYAVCLECDDKVCQRPRPTNTPLKTTTKENEKKG